MTWLRSYPTRLVMQEAIDRLPRQERRNPQRDENHQPTVTVCFYPLMTGANDGTGSDVH